MKRLQSEQAHTIFYDSLGIDPKTIYDFPSYWGLSLNTSYSRNRHSYELNVGFNATGGRLHYADYSGSIKIDKQVSSTNLSLGYSYLALDKGDFKIALGLGLGVSFSSLSTSDIVEIHASNEMTNETREYDNKQLFINPDVSFYYFPFKTIFLQFKAGYVKQFYSSGLQDSEPNSSDGPASNLKLDWSGFRVGAGVGLKIDLKK